MFDLWSAFVKTSDPTSNDPAASSVTTFFDGLFKQPSQSDPSSWNDYTTGYNLPAEAEKILNGGKATSNSVREGQSALEWTDGHDADGGTVGQPVSEPDAWGDGYAAKPCSADIQSTEKGKHAVQTDREANESRGDNVDDGEHAGTKTPRIVADTRYYDCLDLTPDAATSEIRKAYYRLALKCHPDKNPGDPEAHKKFQAIGEAYQVLNDPKRRAEYDKFGVAATNNMNFIDPALFFMMLFGSEQLDPYIGKLKMAKLLEVLTQDDFLAAMAKKPAEGGASQMRDSLMESVEEDQQRRQVTLALKLRERIEPFVIGEEEEWKLKMAVEVEEMCKASFAETIIESLGWAYENYATAYIGEVQTVWGLGAAVANVQATGRSIGNTFAMAKSMVQAAVAATDIQARHEKKMKESTASTEGPQAGTLPNRLDTQDINRVGEILQSVLSIVACDVEDTARKAAEKVCRDESVVLETRVRRAEALQWLGTEMTAAAARAREAKKNEQFDVSRHMEDAFIKATKAADGKGR